MQGRERPKIELYCFKLVGSRFNKQRDLLRRFVWAHKMNKSPCLPARILKVCSETLIEISHLFSPDGLRNTWLYQGLVFEMISTMETAHNIDFYENGAQKVNFKDRRGDEESLVPWVQLGVDCAHVLWMTSSKSTHRTRSSKERVYTFKLSVFVAQPCFCPLSSQ